MRKYWPYALIATFVIGIVSVFVTIPPANFKSSVPDGFATGWVEDKAAVEKVLESSEVKVFSQTPAGNIGDDLPQHVFLWDNYVKLFGVVPPPQNQGQVGSCVSFGTSRALELTLCYQIVKGDRFKFLPMVEEVIYAGSRVEIGGGQINGDGSIGAWAAEYVQKRGSLLRGKYLTYDLSKYSEARARQWGNTGVPVDLMPEVKKYPTADAALVTTWQEAKKALAQGYGIAVCSMQGFTMQRDAKGICYPQGTWAHCMSIDGYYVDTNGKEYGHITNSWGANAHTGAVGWGNPSSAGFWTPSNTIANMLAQKDSWAFSGVKGFPARKLDWVEVIPKDRPIFAKEFTLAW